MNMLFSLRVCGTPHMLGWGMTFSHHTILGTIHGSLNDFPMKSPLNHRLDPHVPGIFHHCSPVIMLKIHIKIPSIDAYVIA